MRTYSKASAGFSLIELVIVVVIIAILIAGLFGRALFGRTSASAQGEVQDITQIMGAVQGYKSQGGYGASGTNLVPVLIAGGAIPSDWNGAGTTITNSFGGAVTVASNGGGFTVTTGSLPQAACVTLAQNIAKQGVVSTTINGGSAITGTVPAATAATQCTTGTANSVSWATTN